MEDKVPAFLKEMLEKQYGNQLTEEEFETLRGQV